MKDQNGFAAVAVVFIVLALAVIGGIAYVQYVYLPNMAAQTNNPSQAASSSTSGVPPAGTSTVAVADQSSNSVNGCGSDATCFIQAAKTCSPTTAIISVKQPIDLDLVDLTEQLAITGGQPGNCSFSANQSNAVVALNPAAYQAMKAQADLYLAQGQITQQQYDAGLLQVKDISTNQVFWNTQKGVSYKCSIPSNVLVPILQGWLIPQAWSSTTEVNFSLTGLSRYCQISAPNVK